MADGEEKEEEEIPDYIPIKERRMVMVATLLQKKNPMKGKQGALKDVLERLPEKKLLVYVWAKGIQYTELMPTGWNLFSLICDLSDKECNKIRWQWHILVEGEDILSRVKNSKDMRFPEPVLRKLKAL